jgi:hypothetical protein
MDLVCSNSRSVPNTDVGNCLFVFIIRTGLTLPLSFGANYIKVLTGVLFTLGRYLDTTTGSSLTCKENCRKFQTPFSITYNAITWILKPSALISQIYSWNELQFHPVPASKQSA